MATIALEGVGKRYRLTDDTVLAKHVARVLTRRRTVRELWALRDIDLEIEAGETVGIIGRNGSGKTTMLRLLAGVSAPTTGRLRVEGSLAPLIGVGVGFNSELTGRENVFANGRILGLSKAQLQRDLDSIVAFAELEDFVETPVKFYSSGMFLRLAFAVAIHVEPEVLLVDEVLAVGDLAFQLKCFERMAELRDRGTTIVLVTHNLGLLNRMCDRAVVLSHGEKRFDGGVDEALGVYHDVMRTEQAARRSTPSLLDQQGAELLYQGGADVDVEVHDAHGAPSRHIQAGAPLSIRVTASFETEVRDPLVGFAVGTGVYGGVYMAHTRPGDHVGSYGPGRPLRATVHLRTPLLEGSYHVTVNVTDGAGALVLGASAPAPFYVTTTSRATGIVDMGAEIEIVGQSTVCLAGPGASPRDG